MVIGLLLLAAGISCLIAALWLRMAELERRLDEISEGIER